LEIEPKEEGPGLIPGPLATVPVLLLGLRPGHCRVGLPHGRQDLLDGGLEEKPLLGHLTTIYQDREFASVSVHQGYFDSWLLPQGIRQTGGMLADTSSDRTLADNDVLHGIPSFYV